jgi:hypothetical protein
MKRSKFTEEQIIVFDGARSVIAAWAADHDAAALGGERSFIAGSTQVRAAAPPSRGRKGRAFIL